MENERDGSQQTTHAPTAESTGSAAQASSGLNAIEARTTLGVADDILLNSRDRGIASAPPRYQHALRALYESVTGHGAHGEVAGPDRLKLFKQAQHELGHAVAIYSGSGGSMSWVQTHIVARLESQEQALSYGEAKYRVEHSRLDPHGVKENVAAGSEAAELEGEITKLHQSVKTLNEQFIRIAHRTVEKEVEHLTEAGAETAGEVEIDVELAETEHAPHAGAKARPAAHGGAKGEGHAGPSNHGASSLLEIQNTLMLFSGWTKLNDKEFQAELGHIHGFFPGVASYSELLKAIAEFTAGAMGTMFSSVAVLAKMMGEKQLVQQMLGLSRSVGHWGSTAVAGIEIIHGAAVLLDSKASTGEKTDAAIDVASGSAWLGSYAAETWGGVAMEGATAVGAAASTAILIAYEEFKYSMKLYGDSKLGLSKLYMGQAFGTMESRGAEISRDGEALTKCQILLAAEKDPKRRAALKKLETDLAANLGHTIDLFIESCDPQAYAAGVAQYPGAYTILREAFEGLGRSRGATTPQATVAAATATLKKISWALGHSAQLIKANAMGESLGEMNAKAAKAEHGGEQAEPHGVEGKEPHHG